jgi:DNA-binding transcriptional ArsR family regulator
MLAAKPHPTDAAFAALGDPTRRAILARLADGELGVMDLAKPFTMSQPAISAHLKVLENAGLIERRIDGTRRPCRIAPGGLSAVEDWLAGLHTVMSARYDRLDTVLAAMTPDQQKEDR